MTKYIALKQNGDFEVFATLAEWVGLHQTGVVTGGMMVDDTGNVFSFTLKQLAADEQDIIITEKVTGSVEEKSMVPAASPKVWVAVNNVKKTYEILKDKSDISKYNGVPGSRIDKYTSLAEAKSACKNYGGYKCIDANNTSDIVKVAHKGGKYDELIKRFDLHPKCVKTETKASDVASGVVEAYVDGSYYNTRKCCGSGVFFVSADKEEGYNSASRKSENIESQSLSGEICAAVMAVDLAISQGYKEIVIKHDCEGIGKWARGDWKAKKSITRSYVDFINCAKEKINISFSKVPAHSGVMGNVEADALAKSATKT